MTRPYIERVVLGEDRGLCSWLIRLVLWPLSVLYRVGLAAYLAAYRLGLRKRHVLSVPVISVGNLTFGGTGKTPAVLSICRMLTQREKRVVVLSRGHGGSAKGSLIVSDGTSILCDAAESGDEPMLLACSLLGVPVIVGKDRRVTGELACERFSPDIILLDDGLQYWQLNRDLDILVLDAKKPFGSGFVMPMGDLREPLSGLSRAGVVLATNSSEMDESAFADLGASIQKFAPNTHIYRCTHTPSTLIRVRDGEPLTLDWLRSAEVVAFCGIGHPESFTRTLESLGAVVVKRLDFPDHHPFSDQDIEMIETERKANSARAVVTTEKDIARLSGKAAINDLYTLGITLEIEDSASFAEYISNRIND
ncbi:MAG: tetraacyldisaccharide 4'-kinase [Armatimonadota bacterium]|nr:tetraacyldisaccharide 4'-kinase [bacterium]